MQTLPRRVTGMVLGVAGAALVALVAAFVLVPVSIDRHSTWTAALLALLVFAARLYPLHVAPRTKTTVATAPLFAAALALRVPVAMVVGATGSCTADVSRNAPWFQTLFNAAEATLRVGAGAAVFRWLGRDKDLIDLEPSRQAAVLFAAVIMYLVNNLVVESMVAVQMRRFALPAFVRRRWADAPREGALLLLGLGLTWIAARFPWALILPTALLFFVHFLLHPRLTKRRNRGG